MKVISSFEALENRESAITIGNFDGLHLGHLKLLDTLTSYKKHSVVISFKNHPSTLFSPENPKLLLSTNEQKIVLLEKHRIDTLLLLPFTRDFANQSALDFIKRLKEHLTLTHLILGYDSRFGKDRGGDPSTILDYSKKEKFIVEYLAAVTIDQEIVSSSLIREAIQQKAFKKAKKLLGRPFSIFAKVEKGLGIGRSLGFPTINLSLEGLVHPPVGVYSVAVCYQNQLFPAIANLGFAPTFKNLSYPILEVHLLENIDSFMHNETLEVFFHQWIREEKEWDSKEALKKQIQKDCKQAKEQLSTMDSLQERY